MNEFYLFFVDHWKLDSDFHISLLYIHLRKHLETTMVRPKILYIQADNSAAETKNKYMLYFSALLVYNGWFEEVYIYTLIPGHTHEVNT